MKILVIPDSFKGSLPAIGFCEIVKKSFSKEKDTMEINCIPLADGGEGTIDALEYAGAIKIEELVVEGANGHPRPAKYGFGDDNEAIIEMAQASGMDGLSNPLYTSTFGTGQLIKRAIDKGYKKIIVTLGGSATNDGGAGMAQALGFQLLDKKGYEIPKGGKALINLNEIVEPAHLLFENVGFVAACDVKNPLLGAYGASHVYGPQKGASLGDVDQLEKGLHQLNETWKAFVGRDFKDVPGGGAAGGLGAGMMAFLNARYSSGFEIINSLLNIEAAIASADVVITGEGSLDKQTLQGKLVDHVARLSVKHKKLLIVVAGKIDQSIDWRNVYSVHKTYALTDYCKNYQDPLVDAAIILNQIINEEILPLIKDGKIHD